MANKNPPGWPIGAPNPKPLRCALAKKKLARLLREQNTNGVGGRDHVSSPYLQRLLYSWGLVHRFSFAQFLRRFRSGFSSVISSLSVVGASEFRVHVWWRTRINDRKQANKQTSMRFWRCDASSSINFFIRILQWFSFLSLDASCWSILSSYIYTFVDATCIRLQVFSVNWRRNLLKKEREKIKTTNEFLLGFF